MEVWNQLGYFWSHFCSAWRDYIPAIQLKCHLSRHVNNIDSSLRSYCTAAKLGKVGGNYWKDFELLIDTFIESSNFVWSNDKMEIASC